MQNALYQSMKGWNVASLEARGIPTERIWKYGFAFWGKEVLIGIEEREFG